MRHNRLICRKNDEHCRAMRYKLEVRLARMCRDSRKMLELLVSDREAMSQVSHINPISSASDSPFLGPNLRCKLSVRLGPSKTIVQFSAVTPLNSKVIKSQTVIGAD